MWSIRQRLRQLSPLVILCSFMLAAGFVVQLHTWYNNHQKYQRIQSYKSYMNELTDTMNNIERVANKTSVLISKLEKSMRSQTDKGTHKIS